MREIVGGVVRYRDLVAKIKIAKFFSWRVLLVIRENFPLYGRSTSHARLLVPCMFTCTLLDSVYFSEVRMTGV